MAQNDNQIEMQDILTQCLAEKSYDILTQCLAVYEKTYGRDSFYTRV